MWGGRWNNWYPQSNFIPAWRGGPIRNRHFISLILFLSAFFTVIIISGCTTSAISSPSLYLVEMQYSSGGQDRPSSSVLLNTAAYSAFKTYTSSTNVKIRTGYFAICVNGASGDWTCSTNATSLANHLGRASVDPLNLLYLSNQLRKSSISPWLLIISMILSFLTAFLLLAITAVHTLGFRLILLMALLSLIFQLLAMVWQQSFANTVGAATKMLSQQQVVTHAGTPVAGLGWTNLVILGLIVFWFFASALNEEIMEDVAEKEAMLSGGVVPPVAPPMAQPVMAPMGAAMGAPLGSTYSRHSHHSHNPIERLIEHEERVRGRSPSMIPSRHRRRSASASTYHRYMPGRFNDYD